MISTSVRVDPCSGAGTHCFTQSRIVPGGGHAGAPWKLCASSWTRSTSQSAVGDWTHCGRPPNGPAARGRGHQRLRRPDTARRRCLPTWRPPAGSSLTHRRASARGTPLLNEPFYRRDLAPSVGRNLWNSRPPFSTSRSHSGARRFSHCLTSTCMRRRLTWTGPGSSGNHF
jgi:hypothetical protein